MNDKIFRDSFWCMDTRRRNWIFVGARSLIQRFVWPLRISWRRFLMIRFHKGTKIVGATFKAFFSSTGEILCAFRRVPRDACLDATLGGNYIVVVYKINSAFPSRAEKIPRFFGAFAFFLAEIVVFFDVDCHRIDAYVGTYASTSSRFFLLLSFCAYAHTASSHPWRVRRSISPRRRVRYFGPLRLRHGKRHWNGRKTGNYKT